VTWTCLDTMVGSSKSIA